jgi:hypothetical protein
VTGSKMPEVSVLLELMVGCLRLTEPIAAFGARQLAGITIRLPPPPKVS